MPSTVTKIEAHEVCLEEVVAEATEGRVRSSLAVVQ
jgi:hypothetical protein